MDVPLGVVIMALELVPTSKRLFGSDILQGNTEQSRHGHSEESHSRPSCNLSGEARLGQASWHEARAHGLAGLGPYLIQGVRVMDRTPQG